MGETTEYGNVQKKIFEPIGDMVKASLYKDEQDTLQHLVHDQAEQKKDYYGKKITEMEQKYMMDFCAFKIKINSRIGAENFEEWDDFIIWESYVKAYRYWEQFL